MCVLGASSLGWCGLGREGGGSETLQHPPNKRERDTMGGGHQGVATTGKVTSDQSLGKKYF